jgi:hypothetical protein
MGEYTDYPADYAEVSSSFRSGQQSPAPYATTTLIGSSKLGNSNDVQRYNMFYYPQMTTSNGNYNRSIHSDSYANNNSNNNDNHSNKINIVENRMAATMMFNQRHQLQQPLGGSNKRNRLKLMKPQNIRNYFSNQGEQLYVKVGEINQAGSASSSSQQHTPQSNNGSINWSQQNINIYENQMHNHKSRGDAENGSIYNGNNSVMSYMSSKDFPENV